MVNLVQTKADQNMFNLSYGILETKTYIETHTIMGIQSDLMCILPPYVHQFKVI